MKKLAIISTIVLGLGLASCDSYMDINQNPNSPQESNMTSDKLLPGAELNLAGTYGNYLRIVGGYYAEHYAQTFGTSNYLDYSQFSQSAARSSSAYTQLNSRALKSLNYVLSISESEEDWGTFLAATTLRAFIYQSLVDCYGEVPYTEALDASNPSPHYDEGTTVYAGILAELDEALSKVNGSETVATNFLFPGATADKWVRFANALKLRILTRESAAVSVDSEIAALVSEGNFPADDVAYAGFWSNEPGQMSPFYAEEFATNWGSTQINVVANIAIIGTMLQKDANDNVIYEDPRLAAFFNANEASGEYTGGVSGTNFSTSDVYKSTYFCRPAASATMPVYLITVAETEFLIAEYYAKQNNAAQAAAHYAAAVEASFQTAGVGGADANVAQFPYDQSNWKQVLGVAKWVALSGVNNFEAYCELRRLRYPAFGSVTGSNLYNLGKSATDYTPDRYVPGTLYTPIQVFGEVGSGKLLERWPYAESSSSRNGNSPDFKGYTTPIFWAN